MMVGGGALRGQSAPLAVSRVVVVAGPLKGPAADMVL